MKAMNQYVAVAIDTETTGLEPSDATVIEIAALPDMAACELLRENPKLPWPVVDEFCAFDGRIPPASQAVHHITKEMLADAPSRATVVNEVIQMLSKLPKEHRFLAAHHAEFDSKFLPELDDEVWICTERLARHLWPDLESYGLQFLRYELVLDCAPEGAPHRAMYDTECCLWLLDRELSELALRGHDNMTPRELAEWISHPVLMGRCPIGDHRGKPFSVVPKHFLGWMIRKERTSPGTWSNDLLHTAKHYFGN